MQRQQICVGVHRLQAQHVVLSRCDALDPSNLEHSGRVDVEVAEGST
jgi:hypothetical protein